MTPTQKTADVLKTVTEARRWYTQAEYVEMVRRIWSGLDSAQAAALPEAPAQVVQP